MPLDDDKPVEPLVDRDVSIVSASSCAGAGCVEVHVFSITNPPAGGAVAVVNIHGNEVSFGITQDALCSYLRGLAGGVPTSGVVKIEGRDGSDKQRCYCLFVDDNLKGLLSRQSKLCR